MVSCEIVILPAHSCLMDWFGGQVPVLSGDHCENTEQCKIRKNSGSKGDENREWGYPPPGEIPESEGLYRLWPMPR